MYRNEVCWREFKVSDILSVEQTNSVVSKEKLIEGNIPYVTRTAFGNGISCMCGNIDRVNDGNCITIGAESGFAFYQGKDFVAGNKIYRLSRNGLTDKEYLFLVSVLNKKALEYSYSNARIPEKIKKEVILLPVKEDGTPNWEYMAERIKELEAERIKELEAYLLATGLEDYELTEEDKQVLTEQPQLKEFKIGELFDVINNPQLDKENFVFSDNALYPYFTRTENNNGVFGYVEYLDDEHKIEGNSLAVGMISMKFHYMSHDFYAGQFTKTLIPKFKNFNETLALFFVSILNKYSSYYQGYLVREFVPRVKNTVCKLPVGKDGQPNWDYMERYIRATEKLVIADTVKWKDKMIEVTKSVVA